MASRQLAMAAEAFKLAGQGHAWVSLSELRNHKNSSEKESSQRKRPFKRPQQPFLIFCNDMRVIIKRNNPELDDRSVISKLSNIWRNLGEEGKKKYEEHYQQKMAEYRQELQEDNEGAESHSTIKAVGTSKQPDDQEYQEIDENSLPVTPPVTFNKSNEINLGSPVLPISKNGSSQNLSLKGQGEEEEDSLTNEDAIGEPDGEYEGQPSPLDDGDDNLDKKYQAKKKTRVNQQKHQPQSQVNSQPPSTPQRLTKTSLMKSRVGSSTPRSLQNSLVDIESNPSSIRASKIFKEVGAGSSPLKTLKKSAETVARSSLFPSPFEISASTPNRSPTTRMTTTTTPLSAKSDFKDKPISNEEKKRLKQERRDRKKRRKLEKEQKQGLSGQFESSNENEVNKEPKKKNIKNRREKEDNY